MILRHDFKVKAKASNDCQDAATYIIRRKILKTKVHYKIRCFIFERESFYISDGSKINIFLGEREGKDGHDVGLKCSSIATQNDQYLIFLVWK